jgi:hypothetical protein
MSNPFKGCLLRNQPPCQRCCFYKMITAGCKLRSHCPSSSSIAGETWPSLASHAATQQPPHLPAGTAAGQCGTRAHKVMAAGLP